VEYHRCVLEVTGAIGSNINVLFTIAGGLGAQNSRGVRPDPEGDVRRYSSERRKSMIE
jgi:hypothetical protein